MIIESTTAMGTNSFRNEVSDVQGTSFRDTGCLDSLMQVGAEWITCEKILLPLGYDMCGSSWFVLLGVTVSFIKVDVPLQRPWSPKVCDFLPRFPQADPTGQVIGLNLPQQHVVRLFQVETYHPPDIYIYIVFMKIKYGSRWACCRGSNLASCTWS